MSSSPFPSHSSLCIDKDHPIRFTKELKALLLPPDTFRVLFLHFCKSAWEHLQGGSCLVWLLLLPRVLLLSEVEREKAHQKGQVWVHHHQNSQWPQQHNQYQQRQHHHKSAQVCLASNYELRVTEIYSPKNREEEKKKKKNSSSLDLLRGITFLLRILEGWIGLSRRAGDSGGDKIFRPRRHVLSVKVQELLAVHCGPRPVASGHEVSWFVKEFGLYEIWELLQMEKQYEQTAIWKYQCCCS